MKPLEMSAESCGLEKEKACVGWVMEYFKDCLCSLRDEISFGFGIASLICWGVAEIPQIITNFNNKSADGVSLAFISTWIVGDIFNLIGCILEPATLPTQYYTALLYTTTTIVLALQCLYYDHFLPLWNRNDSETIKENDERTTLTKKLNGNGSKLNVPIEVPRRKEFHFISARSLAGSDNSPYQSSYMKPKSGPPVLDHLSESSSDDENDTAAALPAVLSYPKPLSQPRPIPRPAGYGTFLAVSAYIPRVTKGYDIPLMYMGRKLLLQEQDLHSSNEAYGQWLGWLMAAIYMGGRLPQIWLNIKRGSVEVNYKIQ
ncbi:OLC1v1017856C2 [Oldenlandia corymbosa var. corymbosa]|uniref:OLC1v1017856C2 n=1 Tax=Oldenlandia corymbosa var. corymbosa TaxID=529605 RepID=A0AAV1EAP0_OLDCO|nr:OLC1v1017856C2 [Oldenlandia corymbosa var. corymbosa]